MIAQLVMLASLHSRLSSTKCRVQHIYKAYASGGPEGIWLASTVHTGTSFLMHLLPSASALASTKMEQKIFKKCRYQYVCTGNSACCRPAIVDAAFHGENYAAHKQLGAKVRLAQSSTIFTLTACFCHGVRDCRGLGPISGCICPHLS